MSCSSQQASRWSLKTSLLTMAEAKIVRDGRPDLRVNIKKANSETSSDGGPGLKSEAISGASICAANTSGFGVYQTSTTVLSKAASAFSTTLPFTVYTGVAKVISWATGAAGLVALGASTLLKLVMGSHDSGTSSRLSRERSRIRLPSSKERRSNSKDAEDRNSTGDANQKGSEWAGIVKTHRSPPDSTIGTVFRFLFGH